jgi:hypothetical protein
VTGLHAEVRIPDLDALSLGVGDGHDQGYDTEHNQEQSGIQQHFHINILIIIALLSIRIISQSVMAVGDPMRKV